MVILTSLSKVFYLNAHLLYFFPFYFMSVFRNTFFEIFFFFNILTSVLSIALHTKREI